MKQSNFYKPPTFKERLDNIKYGILFWKGRSKGMIYTRDIELDDLRYIFFPKGFEKYGYLGYIPYREEKTMMHALVMAMDAEAKPTWCPRWFLRFLDVFGNDKSIVRVRNRKLHNLFRKLTKGIVFWDYKTKWSDYDLRISISSPQYLQDLADAIEDLTYRRGRKQELIDEIKEYEPEFNKTHLLTVELEKYLEELENKKIK
jgi:hypothetical protein